MPYSRISWKKRARNMRMITIARSWFVGATQDGGEMVAKKTKGHSGADNLREEEG